MAKTVISALHVMIKFFLLTIILTVANTAFACKPINGKYRSVSETHWNFELEITDRGSILTYTDYSYGKLDARTDITQVEQGYCEKEGAVFLLIFGEREIPINFHAKLSHKNYGAEGSSPGITGEFIEGQMVHLWLLN